MGIIAAARVELLVDAARKGGLGGKDGAEEGIQHSNFDTRSQRDPGVFVCSTLRAPFPVAPSRKARQDWSSTRGFEGLTNRRQGRNRFEDGTPDARTKRSGGCLKLGGTRGPQETRREEATVDWLVPLDVRLLIHGSRSGLSKSMARAKCGSQYR